MASSRIDISHDFLTDLMKALGYRSDAGGICHGVAVMGLQAILAGELDIFDQRLANLSLFPLEKLLAYKNRDESSENIKQLFTPEELEQVIDIFAFLDGVEIYHQAVDHLELFENKRITLFQNIINNAQIVSSQKIEREQGISSIDQFYGMYNEETLKDYFDSLLQSIKENPDIKKPFALTMSSHDHTLVISYDLLKDKWIFIDANFLERRYVSKSETLAKNIFQIKDENEAYAFISSEIFSTEKDFSAIKLISDQWKKYREPEKDKTFSYHNLTTIAELASWLHFSINNGDLAQVKAIFENKKIDFDELISTYFHKYDASPLITAANCDSLSIVRYMLKDKRIDPNIYKNGVNALSFAAAHGRADIVAELLLDERVIPDALALESDRSPLQYAVYLGYDDVVRLLLQDGRSSLDREYEGRSIIEEAIKKGHPEVVSLLLNDTRIDPNKYNAEGLSLIDSAVAYGQNEVLKVLLADKRIIRDTTGDTVFPLYRAAEMNRPDLIETLLKDKQTLPNQVLANGHTALHRAVHSGYKEAVRALLRDPRVDVNTRIYNSQVTPLLTAVTSGFFSIVKMLVSAGAKLDAGITHSQESFLKRVNPMGKEDKMQALMNEKIHAGADPASITILPLEMAKIMGHDEITGFLESVMNKTPKKHPFFVDKKSVNDATMTPNASVPVGIKRRNSI